MLLAGWFAVAVTAGAVLSNGQPRLLRSTQFVIATRTYCNSAPCSRIDVIPAASEEGSDGGPAGQRTLATVDGRVTVLWYAADGTIRYVAARPEGTWPDIEWRTDLWSMNRDGSRVRLVRRDYDLDKQLLYRDGLAKLLPIPLWYDTNYDRPNDIQRGEALYVALRSPDGRFVVSVVSGIDSARVCVSEAERWDPSFRTARCFGDGSFSLPVWVAN
jgi:hypothetical protein